MESYLVSQALWDITYMKDTTPLEEATTRAKWIAKVSRALFAIIEISMDDNMLDHIMDVMTPKEGCGTFASIFFKKPKSKDGKVCVINAENEGTSRVIAKCGW